MEGIRIEMRTRNSAFIENKEGEVARILRELADQIESGREPALIDFNGNRVGTVDYE